MIQIVVTRPDTASDIRGCPRPAGSVGKAIPIGVFPSVRISRWCNRIAETAIIQYLFVWEAFSGAEKASAAETTTPPVEMSNHSPERNPKIIAGRLPIRFSVVVTCDLFELVPFLRDGHGISLVCRHRSG